MCIRSGRDKVKDFQVTICGESSGSWSVFYQMLSPKSKGLFKGVIGESGTPLSPAWPNLTPAKAKMYGERLIKHVGCAEAHNTLRCMKEKPLEDIIEQSMSVDDQGKQRQSKSRKQNCSCSYKVLWAICLHWDFDY